MSDTRSGMGDAIQEAIRYADLEDKQEDIVRFAEYVMKDEKGDSWKVGKHHKEWYMLALSVVLPLLNGKTVYVDGVEVKPQYRDGEQLTNGVIEGPREHGKTETIVCLALFILGINPSLRIKVVSNTDTNAIKFITQVEKNIISNNELHEVFPGLVPDPRGSWAGGAMDVLKDEDANLGIKDCSIEGYGATAAATGGRTDLILFDDIVGARETITEPARLPKIKQLFFHDWLNIGGQSHIYIGSAWSPDDLIEDLVSHEMWHVWKEPAINEAGEPLWPERWPLYALEKRRKEIGDEAFDQQFLLKGLRQSRTWWTQAVVDVCKAEDLQVGQSRVPIIAKYCGLDPAASLKNTGSFSCITAIGLMADERRVLLEIIRMREPPEIVAEKVVEMHIRHSFSNICVENNATQEAMLSLIRVIAEFKYAQELELPLEGFFTGSQKWNPEIGLPGLVAEMRAERWDFPFAGDHTDLLHSCEICDLIKEMLGFPYETKTTDMIMSLWLALSAADMSRLISDVPVGIARHVKRMG